MRGLLSCATGTTLATVWDLLSGIAGGVFRDHRWRAWDRSRLADSLALRRFLGIGPDEQTPDHSTISRTRRLIDIDKHREVFAWVSGCLAERGLLKGQRMAKLRLDGSHDAFSVHRA